MARRQSRPRCSSLGWCATRLEPLVVGGTPALPAGSAHADSRCHDVLALSYSICSPITAGVLSAPIHFPSRLQAGIDVFVTGGIGGVHRGAESTMDVSADLTELGRTDVAVVCAGVKSILDIGRTLEYLVRTGYTHWLRHRRSREAVAAAAAALWRRFCCSDCRSIVVYSVE